MSAPCMEVFVEIPRGSNNKYEFDKEKGMFRLDRVLYSPVYYPADYGFIQNTLADDGDPLDAMVITTFPTFPGCLIKARIIGMFIMEDEKGRDEKILGVPSNDPRFENIRSLEDLENHILKEFEHFFSVYKNLEEKEVIVKGWAGVEEAVKTIAKSRENYK
ncbi:inorganic diphosphatase [Sporosalibacterium faouarense]|uniref:inorganic diphosphatase n=1 Tax=Sporosalibacterium faouarense TaxID=516123 RepID=UPI001FAFC674|nr:inorganic diphosphatase [Sporosalibacterium faouarense]